MYDDASAYHCTEDYVNVNFPIKNKDLVEMQRKLSTSPEEAKYFPGPFP